MSTVTDFKHLAQALNSQGLLYKSLHSMSRQEIEDLCKIVFWNTCPKGTVCISEKEYLELTTNTCKALHGKSAGKK